MIFAQIAHTFMHIELVTNDPRVNITTHHINSGFSFHPLMRGVFLTSQ